VNPQLENPVTTKTNGASASSVGQKEKYVTLSVDDGHPTDLRTVDLLHKYGLTATFYVPATNHERVVLTPTQVRDIDRQFEVGSHTWSHIRLTLMSDEKARREVVDGKKFSEDTLGHEVVAFCYPGGKFTRRIETHVEEAGFLAGRTCRYFLNDYPKNPFSWDISTYANTYPAYVQVRHCLLEYNFAGAYKYLTTFRASVPWVTQFVCALDDVAQNGGMAHLYFHSWEIDQNGEWDKLESLFQTIAQYKQQHKVTPVTNSFLYRRWHEQRAASGAIPTLVNSQPLS
jgi:peptidoglycan/xylan/chitin deacetylase (PgdA/CDA1 family)